MCVYAKVLKINTIDSIVVGDGGGGDIVVLVFVSCVLMCALVHPLTHRPALYSQLNSRSLSLSGVATKISHHKKLRLPADIAYS